MNNKIYNTIVSLTEKAREDLKNCGVAVPIQDKNGKIKIGKYEIIRKGDGQYKVINDQYETVYDNLNLLQTAILVANSLATNQRINREVLRQDLVYGTKMFDDINYDRLSKTYLNQRKFKQSANMSIQSDYAADLANRARNAVLKTYEKLFRLY